MTQEFRRREISRNGVRLSYLDNDAAGPVVILLHGLAGAGDEFTATARAVGAAYQFVLPDLRGHGASTRRPADLSRAAFTSDVAALIRHVSPGGPVALAGQSMGGQTAILTAAAHPELVERLVLLEADAAGGADAARIGSYFRSWPLPFASADAALEFLGDDALSRSWVSHLEPAAAGGLVPPFEADVMEAVMVGVADPIWQQWKSVAAPYAAVFAAKSMFSPEAQAEFVAARPGTRHVVLPSGSHDAHLDATAEWAAVLHEALTDRISSLGGERARGRDSQHGSWPVRKPLRDGEGLPTWRARRDSNPQPSDP
jgi:pimeloyl-ACP methyl ester carboxylesterase